MNNKRDTVIQPEHLILLCGAILLVVLIAFITIGHPSSLIFEEKNTQHSAYAALTVTYPESSESSSSSLLNINTADALELMTLPGVGEATAKAILDYRREHGLFRSTEELIHVTGIGEKKLEEILPYITVD